jgi:hypothetical protein
MTPFWRGRRLEATTGVTKFSEFGADVRRARRPIGIV